VLHLATHGFLLEGPASAAATTQADTARRGVGALVEPPATRVELAGSVDASVAGLALAGANVESAGRPAADDGILTAAEIAALDLSRVRCVLLSACRTGESRADRFESLQGLERALRVAGAGQVVMSLWPVADADAREWMRAFYAAWRGRGLGLAEAVRSADLERLRALTRDGVAPRPDRWAPFFARGERE
jgi:CHAT domain-containing protein